ncbi:MAG: EAL domain-containing protein [Gammaproteobacteria bacterium]|nr:MAG: EAL domain-containing protein [Gammaproteobacteria bacterium]
MPDKDLYRLLFLLPSPEEAEKLASALRNAGLLIQYRHLDSAQALAPLLQEPWDLLLSQAGVEAIQALAVLKKKALDIPLIVLSKEIATSEALDPLAYGARDVIDPAIQPLFVHAVTRELETLEARRALAACHKAQEECEERNRILVDSSRDAIAYIHEGMHIYANPAYLERFGFDSQEEIAGIPLLDLIAPEAIPSFKALLRRYQEKGEVAPLEIEAVTLEGKRFKTRVELRPARMGGETCMQIVLRDTRAPAPAAHLDPLTGLHFRHHLLEALTEAVARARKGQSQSALLIIALDNLPEIRQALDLQASDRVLAEVARRLKAALPPGAQAARYGEDSFIALLPEAGQAPALAEGWRKEVEGEVFDIEGQTAITTVSIGIVPITSRIQHPEEALKAAEEACQTAMRQGGNRVVLHKMEALEEEQRWPKRLQEAMAKGQLRLYFQPIVPLHGEVKPMYEVLLRLLDKEGHVLLPESFLPYAARAGMMPTLDRWVVTKALAILERHSEPIHLFIKLSDDTLLDQSFMPWLQAKTLPAERVIFEINELSATTHLKQAKVFVEGLKRLGLKVALAHFGEGINPFGILKHIQADAVMIDGHFIRHLAQDPEKQERVRTLVERAKALGKTVIAENVEDANSLALLWQFGVDYARGYYIQVPTETPSFDFLASL